MVLTARLRTIECGQEFTGFPIDLSQVTPRDAMKWQHMFTEAKVDLVDYKTYTDEEWKEVQDNIWKEKASR